MTDKYAVVGYPIAHSKSPLIHRLFAEQTDQDISYEAILIDNEETTFEWSMADLKQRGYKGINITVPFKLDAFEYADTLSSRAQSAHAVNTFLFDDEGKTHGDNTDGIGLVNDIEQNGQRPFSGQKVLILGAGGAVQGIMEPLLAKNPASVHIANRTAKRAEVLGNRFTTEIPISASGWEDIPCSEGYDIIINGTSASLDNKLPPVSEKVLTPDSLVYDMMYGAEPTIFMQWAKKHQPACEVMDGLGMLVGQAAEAFYLWRGVRPETAPVIASVREMMANS
ncbi:shikimate dehydrogenase [Thiomicrorhabdus sp. 6S3-12]|uniref:shikimate dehydrogenase n=1 Tax=Thiomicrorhabdus sp. 6S3-12 TaxID=2819681 RepID=UPI001AAC7492|nr:shikimate dehydrogenase [Thiomicrorhabdus sp. 6S3-12]MBO1924633.1 shikimate dehydrogenase [Thiomicrorhabdus sp. 6S3-12]